MVCRLVGLAILASIDRGLPRGFLCRSKLMILQVKKALSRWLVRSILHRILEANLSLPSMPPTLNPTASASHERNVPLYHIFGHWYPSSHVTFRVSYCEKKRHRWNMEMTRLPLSLYCSATHRWELSMPLSPLSSHTESWRRLQVSFKGLSRVLNPRPTCRPFYTLSTNQRLILRPARLTCGDRNSLVP